MKTVIQYFKDSVSDFSFFFVRFLKKKLYSIFFKLIQRKFSEPMTVLNVQN